MENQDLIIQEKIKKREKVDIIIAYILIAILICCILFVVYLKFIKEDNSSNDNQNEYVVEHISLGVLANNINNNLNSKYTGINATASENSIAISYGDFLYNIKLINNELEFNMNNDNKELSEDIYKEITTSICNYYSNNVDGCKNSSNAIVFGENITGIRFVNNIMYISVINGITPTDIISYTEETIIDIDNTNYELVLNNITISNIEVSMEDVNIIISGNISSEGNITVKLYNIDDELLGEKSITGDDNFSITFDYDDKLNIDSIKKYSISVE